MSDDVPDVSYAVFCGVYFRRRFILVKDKGKKRPHFWKGPGGRGEGNETPLETALREAKEEIGVEVGFLSEVNHPLRLRGRGGSHDFVSFLLKPLVDNEDFIIPHPEEIIVIGLFTDDQIDILRDLNLILPNHYTAYVRLRRSYKFLFEEEPDPFLRAEDLVADDPDNVYLIYEADGPGLDFSLLSPAEKIYSVEKPSCEKGGTPRVIWHAHVTFPHGDQILQYLEREDEKATRAARAARRFEKLKQKSSIESLLEEVRKYERRQR